MTSRRTASLIIQLAASFWAADRAVWAGVPYISLRPLPWWKSALRWPWWAIRSIAGSLQPWQIMLMLFAVYSVMTFLIIRCLISAATSVALPFHENKV